MKDNWTTFEGRPFKTRAMKEPRITIGPRGTMYLNAVAYRALGGPAAVELRFEGNQRKIALKPTDASRTNAFRLMNHGGRYRRLSAASFCQHFRLVFRETKLFEGVEFENGMLVLDLNKTITVTRGAR